MLAAAILQELGVAQVGEGEVPAHGQVGAVELEHEAGVVDGVVLLLHHVGQPGQIRLAVG